MAFNVYWNNSNIIYIDFKFYWINIFNNIFKKLYMTLLNYGIFIISTIITYNLINIIVKILVNNKFISDCSITVYILILIIVENIFSYLIVKIITNNKVRGNFA